MDWEFVAPLVVVVTITLSAAAVLILRPLSKRLGDLIDVTARDKRVKSKDDELARLTDVLGRLTDRIENLEDRLDFNERVLASLDRPEAGSRTRLARPPDS